MPAHARGPQSLDVRLGVLTAGTEQRRLALREQVIAGARKQHVVKLIEHEANARAEEPRFRHGKEIVRAFAAHDEVVGEE